MVVDASVAVKWFLAEDRTNEARALLADEDLIAPGIIRLEVAHVLWKGVRRGAMTPSALESSMDVMDQLFAGAAATDDLIAPAMQLMRRLGHPVYDCLYIALADRVGTTLVTADERQFSAARRARIQTVLL
ncbi:type II toxin-antitoxin system VapC family toxin [Enterovirga rhinocerotis]|uniref:Ribonuclease VapC n=1 Tax=Enterovirga rhinocerotis TaxID=1339210 RepID=A0A4R7C5D2_9HYPH|nr:type II toxin-antitoxin system VapC family toxin [Enterovirga rhinocerotis]TDR93263.1 putative nucleic acid-binding protein [Enterovirga rhinocerotis]